MNARGSHSINNAKGDQLRDKFREFRKELYSVLNLEIRKATIIEQNHGMDIVYLNTNIPGPSALDDTLTLSFWAAKGTAAGYVRDCLKIKDDIVYEPQKISLDSFLIE